jgi:signal transduction histidine kinase
MTDLKSPDIFKPESTLAKYLIGAGTALFALAIRLALTPYTGAGAPFLIFFGAVLISSLIGGRGPGMLSAIIGAPMGTYFFVLPAGYPLNQALFQAALFLVEAVIVTEIAKQLENSRQLAKRNIHTAERAVKLRDDLVSMVAHDLKTPLSTIAMRTEIIRIRAESVNENEIAQHAKGISVSIRMMSGLITDLLDLARIEAGKLKIETALCRCSDLVAAAVDQLLPMITKKSIHLEIEPMNKDLFVKCDGARIHQVLLNILGNAIKFTPDGGTIKIQLIVNVGFTQFEIFNSGPGISEADLPYLFDQFWQARNGNGQGNGLGLAISKGLIEAHNGKIGARSESGMGSTFFFSLPSAKSQA